MSARAMRRLKGDALLLGGQELEDKGNSEEEESDEDDSQQGNDEDVPATRSAFAFLPSDSESSSSEEESDDEQDDDTADGVTSSAPSTKEASDSATIDPELESELEQHEEEDLDAILDEFKQQDEEKADCQSSALNDETMPSSSSYHLLMDDVDPRDLDVDWAMRNALSSADEGGKANVKRSKSRTFLFGNPNNMDTRQIRPPNFVGGGIGMVSYDDQNAAGLGQYTIPEEYKDSTSPSDWYRFMHADGYLRDLQDYNYIQQTGDINSLLLFVAHHPFVTNALLQLSNVLYETNQSQNGQSIVRRCLWVYECAALIRFQNAPLRFMDYSVHENKVFMEAIRKLIHVSSIAGLWRTCLALSRYLLAMDPLRDPMGLLSVIDSYAICCHSESANQWIVNLVQSNLIQIQAEESTQCGLLGMPNWAYSYALALFRISGSESDEARQAMQSAIWKFPGLVGLILQAAEVDTSGRSLRRDWITLVDKATELQVQQRNYFLGGSVDTIAATAAFQAIDKLCNMFAGLSAKVWGDDEVQQFLYDNLNEALNNEQVSEPVFGTLQTGVMKYAQIRASDWQTRIQQLPEDANILDPGLVAQVMVIDTSRPRLLRRMQQQGMDPREMEQMLGGGAAGLGQRGQPIIGGPPTGLVDPDLPLMEVFWRSFLPWNHVEGVRGQQP